MSVSPSICFKLSSENIEWVFIFSLKGTLYLNMQESRSYSIQFEHACNNIFPERFSEGSRYVKQVEKYSRFLVSHLRCKKSKILSAEVGLKLKMVNDVYGTSQNKTRKIVGGFKKIISLRLLCALSEALRY